jgi:hypothetical protein
MPRTLTEELTYHLTLNGMLKMQNALLSWAKVHQAALLKADLIPSLIAMMREELRLHEVSAEARHVIERAAE